jgi:hypothetical protein
VALSALAPACSEPVANGPVSTLGPDPSLAPAPGDRSAPKPAAPSSGPDQPEQPEQPADECAADSDCTTTALPVTPVKSEADCCFPNCQKRVASREEVDALQPLYGASCKAVLCAPQSCPKAPDPVPVCRQGRCIAGP